jgi:hypothetical protein
MTKRGHTILDSQWSILTTFHHADRQTMIEAQRLLASNPETAPEILRELSQSDDRAIRQAVAGNPNVPIEVLWELMHDYRL